MPAAVVAALLLLVTLACSDEVDDLAAWCDAAVELDALQGIDDELHPGDQRIGDLQTQVLEDPPEGIAEAVRTLFDPLETDRGLDGRRYDRLFAEFDEFMANDCHRATRDEVTAFCAAVRELSRRASTGDAASIEGASDRVRELAPVDIEDDLRSVLDADGPPFEGDAPSGFATVDAYVELHCRFTPWWVSTQ